MSQINMIPNRVLRMVRRALCRVGERATTYVSMLMKLTWPRVWRRIFFLQPYKRSCSADGVRSAKNFIHSIRYIQWLHQGATQEV